MKKFVILNDAEDVIRVLGGQTKLALRLGIKQPNVFKWKKRNKIPATQIIPVALALGTKGYVLSADLLNIRGVSGALFATVYQATDEPRVNGSQKRHNSEQSELEFFETGNVAAE